MAEFRHGRRRGFTWNYKDIALIEVMIVIVLGMITLYITYLGISANVGLGEAIPLTSYVFSNFGYMADLIFVIGIPLIAYVVLEFLSDKLGIPWLTIFVFVFIIALKLVDVSHDVSLAMSYGVF